MVGAGGSSSGTKPRRWYQELPAALPLWDARSTHHLCRFPSCSYKTCFTERINKTNAKLLPCQERSRWTEPDHVWFIPPCPQQGDAGFGSAPGGPSQSSDQRSHGHTGILPARTGLSSGTRSQGSPGSGGSLGGPGWRPLPHKQIFGSCCGSSVPAERKGRGLSPPRAPHGPAGRTGQAAAPAVSGRPGAAGTPRLAGERPPLAPSRGRPRPAAPAPRGRAPRPAPGPRR